MTTISAEIIADSVSPQGVRLITYHLVYPRFIHPELMTHRAFARNASSSRAIPTVRMHKNIEADPAQPLHLGKNQPGMQADTTIQTSQERRTVYALWNNTMRVALRCAREMVELCGLHKQIANRITEPFQHMNVVLTATEYDNAFALRCHPMAEPHFRALAWRMADARHGSTPQKLHMGEWHLPYITAADREQYELADLKKFSAARCARVSYKNHDGTKPDPEKDLKLYNRLLAGLIGEDPLEPGHMSPFEHQATPLGDPTEWSGPFRGWKQYRKEFEGENMAFDYEAAVAKGWRDLAYSIFDEEIPPLV